jgi:hypothetical protein
VVAKAVKSILRMNGENGLASDGTLHERYEYTPYGERTRKAGGELPLTPAISRSPGRVAWATRGEGGAAGGSAQKEWSASPGAADSNGTVAAGSAGPGS